MDGSLAYAMADLAALQKVEHVQPGWLCELVAQLQIRHPSVTVVFADSRKLAEDHTYRSFAPAYSEFSPATVRAGS